MRRGTCARWVGVVAAIFLLAAPGWANYLPGGIEGHVIDKDKNDQGLANLYVTMTTKSGNGSWSAMTDSGGHYSFSSIYAGDYTVRIWPGPRYGGGYAGFKQDCTVVGGQVTTVNFDLTHLQPSVSVDVIAPSGTVSGSAPIQIKVVTNPGVYDLSTLSVWTWDARAEYGITLLNGGGLSSAQMVSSRPLDDNGVAMEYILQMPFDPTALDCPFYGGGADADGKATVEIKAAAEFTDGWATDGTTIKKGQAPTGNASAGTAGGATTQVSWTVTQPQITATGQPLYPNPADVGETMYTSLAASLTNQGYGSFYYYGGGGQTMTWSWAAGAVERQATDGSWAAAEHATATLNQSDPNQPGAWLTLVAQQAGSYRLSPTVTLTVKRGETVLYTASATVSLSATVAPPTVTLSSGGRTSVCAGGFDGVAHRVPVTATVTGRYGQGLGGLAVAFTADHDSVEKAPTFSAASATTGGDGKATVDFISGDLVNSSQIHAVCADVKADLAMAIGAPAIAFSYYYEGSSIPVTYAYPGAPFYIKATLTHANRSACYHPVKWVLKWWSPDHPPASNPTPDYDGPSDAEHGLFMSPELVTNEAGEVKTKFMPSDLGGYYRWILVDDKVYVSKPQSGQ